jgi:hypothetical protein
MGYEGGTVSNGGEIKGRVKMIGTIIPKDDFISETFFRRDAGRRAATMRPERPAK